MARRSRKAKAYRHKVKSGQYGDRYLRYSQLRRKYSKKRARQILKWQRSGARREKYGRAENPTTTFKELPVGTVFEFDHSGLSVPWSGARGPWVKSGPRSYYPKDRSSAIKHQKEIERIYGLKSGKLKPHKVGSVNTKVIW